jgi:pimeloyl-ACP methyl ester carboxylesterase
MSKTSVQRGTRRAVVSVAFSLVATLVVALVATATANAVGHKPARSAIGVRNSTMAAFGTQARNGVGIAVQVANLLHGGRATAVRELSSPALRPNSAVALATETPCDSQTPGLLCSQVVVPLDSSGVVAGTISLHVERLPALGVPKGTMFLIAGGPGQGSAHSFDLGNPIAAALFRFTFPGYTLVAYDDRGTGASGLLHCPSLEAAYPVESEATAAASCADAIGPTRDFYGTLDHAADLEAVRASIGVDKVGLYGVSYGTKLALAYALVYGSHVERLLLDSVVQTDQPDPFATNVLKAMPTTLATFCSTGACRAAAPDLAADVVTLANRLAAKPAVGKVLQPNGSTRTERVSGVNLLYMIVEADLNPGLAALMPAVVHEARAGDYRPLLRIYEFESRGAAEAPEDLSSALNAATNCHDGPFPWQPNTPVADRPALYQAALAALPAGSFGPFGSWAASFGDAHFCLQWPSPAGGATYGDGTVPNVPVLAVSGGFDLRTPTAAATAVASKFPQGRVLVVPGVGHSVVGTDPSVCTIDNVRAWLAGGTVATQCPRGNPYLDVVPAFAPARSSASKHESVKQTLALVTKTLREAEGIWLMTNGGVAGLYSGRLVASSPRTFTLVRYSIAPGVELNGKVRFVKFGPPLQFDGTVTVGGAGAARGLLGFSGGKIGGTLDGQIVGR